MSYSTAEVNRLMKTFTYVVGLYESVGFNHLSKLEIRGLQDDLAPVLEMFQESAKAYPTQGALYLNKLGAVLIRLSFLMWHNRHETQEEFEELIKNYKPIENTLQVSVSDLV